jgi:hypothetical protein
MPEVISCRCCPSALKPVASYNNINKNGKIAPVVTMLRIRSAVFWCLGLMLLVSGGSAFTVTGVSITPPGTLNPNDAVNVSYTVYAASGTAFPSVDDLQFVSGIDETVWQYSIIVNGVENVRPVTGGRSLTLSGFELSYQNQDEVIVKATVKGRIPRTSVPGAIKNLVTVQELDARGYPINSTVYTITRLIGSPTPTPTQGYGRITFTSIPSEANIYLDNAFKGLTPLTIDGVPNGNHTVLLRLSKYQDSVRTITVAGNTLLVNIALVPVSAVTTTPTPTPQPTVTVTAVPTTEYGSLSVTTSPSGARVYVDGELKGITPATIPGIAAGKHTLLVSHPGYIDLNTTVIISAGKTAEYTTSLVTPARTPGFGIIAALLAISGLVAARKFRK